MGWDEMRTGRGDGTKREVVKYHFGRAEGMGLGGERYSRGRKWREGMDGDGEGPSCLPCPWAWLGWLLFRGDAEGDMMVRGGGRCCM